MKTCDFCGAYGDDKLKTYGYYSKVYHQTIKTMACPACIKKEERKRKMKCGSTH